MNNSPEAQPFDWVAAKKLPEFLAELPNLSTEERLRIIDEAAKMLRSFYVHLPWKVARYGIDPLAALADLSARAGGETERDFHQAMCDVFASLRDLHTQYYLPSCYQGHVALLPFKMAAWGAPGTERYVVTDRLASYPWGPAEAEFGVGSEILSWNGRPIAEVVNDAGQRSGGVSAAAQQARAAATLTVWPMERQPPPADAVVTVTYAGSAGTRTACFPYAVVAPPEEQKPSAWRHGLGLDHEAEARRLASKHIYHPDAKRVEQLARNGERVRLYERSGAVRTRLPTILEAHRILDDRYAYVRIHSFNVPSPLLIEGLVEHFVEEFRRLLSELPQDGLVLDVRGNGGGILHLAECLLQLLTSRRITPQSLQLRATPEVLAVAGRLPELEAYVPLLNAALASGADHTAALPITPADWCNRWGRSYPGPTVLVTDARSYSTTDAFAAGFQDHGIGPVLGTAPTTGAGGANVWALDDLCADPQPLPSGARLRLAFHQHHRFARRHAVGAARMCGRWTICARTRSRCRPARGCAWRSAAPTAWRRAKRWCWWRTSAWCPMWCTRRPWPICWSMTATCWRPPGRCWRRLPHAELPAAGSRRGGRRRA